jgi:hypothetical protein
MAFPCKNGRTRVLIAEAVAVESIMPRTRAVDQRRIDLRKGVILVLAFTIVGSSVGASAATRRHRPTKRTSSSTKVAADRLAAAQTQAARQAVAEQIKVLTHFMYLLGGIEKGIEMNDPGGREVSPVALELNNRNKAKVKASITSVRQGLEKLETDFRWNPALKDYSPYLTGLANYGEVAEAQAGANRFDEAGRSLLKAVDQLTDALAKIR